MVPVSLARAQIRRRAPRAPERALASPSMAMLRNAASSIGRSPKIGGVRFGISTESRHWCTTDAG